MVRPRFWFLVSALLGGCAIVEQNALEPIDWSDKQVDRYAVTGRGVLARLRNEPITLGPYSAVPEARQLWNHLPVQTTSELHVGLGSDQGRQANLGNTSVRNESELKIRLHGPAGELAAIHCRELLNVENRVAQVTNKRGENDFKVTENLAHDASLHCRSRALGSSWPQWQLDLQVAGKRPLQGILSIDGLAFDIVGSQASTIGVLPETVSYEVRRGDEVLALIDRSGDGRLTLINPMDERQHTSIIGAAAALLLAQDPLNP